MPKLAIFLYCLVLFTSALAAAKQPLLIDTDMGPDDWQAIAYLVNQPKYQIKAITISSTGEVDCQHGIPNLGGMLTLLKQRDIPIACGSPKTLSKHGYKFPQKWVDLANAMMNIKLPPSKNIPIKKSAVNLIINTLKQSPQPVTLIVIGPWTNIARAYLKQPQLFHNKVKTIYSTDGVYKLNKIVYEPGISEKYFHGTWNLHIDPVAGEIMFASGIPIVLITADSRAQLNPASLLPIETIYSLLDKKHRTPASKFIYKILTHKSAARFISDQATAVVAVHPKICRYEYLPMQVLTAPQVFAGKTSPSVSGHPPVWICLHMDKYILIHDFIRGLNISKKG